MSCSASKYRSLLAAQLPRLRAEYHVATLGLFGSYVRGTEGPNSDLDVLVAFDRTPSLLTLIDLEQHLSDMLGVKVDLVLRDSLKPSIGPQVLNELVSV
jgi:predicted nucleotidyltransferase